MNHGSYKAHWLERRQLQRIKVQTSDTLVVNSNPENIHFYATAQ
jgi:hypothetical protein